MFGFIKAVVVGALRVIGFGPAGPIKGKASPLLPPYECFDFRMA